MSGGATPPSSSALAIGHGPQITLWDYSTSQTFAQFNPAHQREDLSAGFDDCLSAVQFSPNGQVIATSSFTSEHAILSQASTGAQLGKVGLPPTAIASESESDSRPGVSSIHFGGGGRYMSLSTYSDTTNHVYIYNLAKMKWARSFTIDTGFQCTKVRFDPTNTLLAALSRKDDESSGGSTGVNSLTLWNVREGKVAASLHYPYMSTNPSVFSQSSRSIERKGAMEFSTLVPHYCAIGCGSSVVLYDVHRATGITPSTGLVGSPLRPKSSEPLFILRDKHQGFVTDVAFNPIARSLIASSSVIDGCVKFHDIVTSKTIQTIYPPVPPSGSSSFPAYADTPTCMSFHSNGVTFAIGTILGNVYVYDLRKCDSPSSSYSYISGDSRSANIDSHVNAIISKWNASSAPTSPDIPPSDVAPVPISHVCFQQNSGSASAQKKVKTPTKRPLSPGNSNGLFLSPQHDGSLNELNRSVAAMESGQTPSKEEEKAITNGRVNGKVKLDLVSDAPMTPSVSTDTTAYRAPAASKSLSYKSPALKTSESPKREQENFNSPPSPPRSMSSSILGHPGGPKLDPNLNNVSPIISHPPMENSPLKMPAVDTSLSISSPSHPSSEFDHIDESLERLMQSLRLGRPLMPHTADEYVNSTSQFFEPMQSHLSTVKSRNGSLNDKGGRAETVQGATAGERPPANDLNIDDAIRTIERGLSTQSSGDPELKQANAESRASILKRPHPNSSITTTTADESDTQGQRDEIEMFLHKARANIYSENITVNKNVLRQLIEDATLELREEFGQSIRNLHIDVIRQFQQQSDEITALFQKQNEVMVALIEENQKLREENEQLRSIY